MNIKNNEQRKVKSEKRMVIYSLFTFHLSLFTFSCQNIKRDQYVSGGLWTFSDTLRQLPPKNGEGMANLYPPISKEFLKNKADVVCWIKNGMHQPIVVNGKTYNRAMPGNQALENLDIAELMTYLYNTYDKESEIFSIDSVAAIRELCVEPLK